MRKMFSACKLAFHDWRHDGLLTACSVLALVSILVPLLMLLGIRNGVIATLKTRLLDNPALLAVTPSGSGSGYTESWLDTLRARPDVAFVIPKTREISTTVQMESGEPGEGARRFSPVDVEPTGPGDPLLARFNAVPTGNRMITLSRPAADRLGVAATGTVPGTTRGTGAGTGSGITPDTPQDSSPSSVQGASRDERAGAGATNISTPIRATIRARIGRTTSAGKMESIGVDLIVAAVLPLEVESRVTGFIPLPLLTAIEDYKDGYAVPELGVSGDTPPETERRFARFRLYTRSMDDVAVLRDMFAAQGLEVQTSALEIKSFQEISRALTLLFVLIAGIVGAGFVASTASSVLAGVRRKDKQLGMLRLIGFSSRDIMMFPLLQAECTAICGVLLAGGLYIAVAYGLDALFADEFYGAAVSLLPGVQFVWIMAGVCGASLLACLPAAARAARIEPSDVLREL